MSKELSAYEIKLMKLVKHYTGMTFSFAVGARRMTAENSPVETAPKGSEGFFQLMPENEFYEAKAAAFFSWYINEHPYNQFFPTRGQCVTEFLHHYAIWAKAQYIID